MASIRRQVIVDRSPDDVWAVVGDPSTIADWFPAIGLNTAAWRLIRGIAIDIAKRIELLSVAELKSGLFAHPCTQATFKCAMLARTEGPEREHVRRSGTVRFRPHDQDHGLIIEHSHDGRVKTDLDRGVLTVRMICSNQAFGLVGRRLTSSRKFHVHMVFSPCSPGCELEGDHGDFRIHECKKSRLNGVFPTQSSR